MAFPAQAVLSAAIYTRLTGADDVVWGSNVVRAAHARPQVLEGRLWLIISMPVVTEALVTAGRRNATALVDILVHGEKYSDLVDASSQIDDLLDRTGRFDEGSKERLALGAGASQAARDSWEITLMGKDLESIVEVERDKGKRIYTQVIRFAASMELAGQIA